MSMRHQTLKEKLHCIKGELNRQKVIFLNRFPAPIEDRITCPARMRPFTPHSKEKNLDRWEKWGHDRVCSFCGSWHPKEFIQFVAQVIVDRAQTLSIELADDHEKFYVNRPQVQNAYDGAIKFKKYHFETAKEYNDAVPNINDALKLSSEALERKFRDV